RADKSDASVLTGSRQRGILGEKPVARMNRIDALLLRERDDALDVKIRLDRAFPFADQIGFIGLETMQTEAVFLGINGNSAEAELVGRPKDSNGDLTAIERKKFFHRKY